MAPLTTGSEAPAIPGIGFGDEPQAVVFYKVTCPTCQMAGPKLEAFQDAYPGRIAGVGQDPEDKLAQFHRSYGLTFPSVPDLPPYAISTAYGVEIVPTTFLVDRDGRVEAVVEAWDRDGLNRISRRLADLTGSAYAPISEPGDGLPPFRPG